jgi:hypothetical protein
VVPDANGILIRFAASNWTWNCILAFAVPPLLWSINWKMYMIFGTFNALAFIHMFLTAPETKGRTLEEVSSLATCFSMFSC